MTDDLYAAIESPEFSARLNVVSGFTQFLRAIGSQPEVLALRESNSSSGECDLLHRVSSLASAPRDPAFEHPHDVALAVYLWLLGDGDPAVAEIAAETVLRHPTWWARKVAEKLLADKNTNAAVGAVEASAKE